MRRRKVQRRDGEDPGGEHTQSTSSSESMRWSGRQGVIRLLIIRQALCYVMYCTVVCSMTVPGLVS